MKAIASLQLGWDWVKYTGQEEGGEEGGEEGEEGNKGKEGGRGKEGRKRGSSSMSGSSTSSGGDSGDHGSSNDSRSSEDSAPELMPERLESTRKILRAKISENLGEYLTNQESVETVCSLLLTLFLLASLPSLPSSSTCPHLLSSPSFSLLLSLHPSFSLLTPPPGSLDRVGSSRAQSY
jgi:hypothetical protein